MHRERERESPIERGRTRDVRAKDRERGEDRRPILHGSPVAGADDANGAKGPGLLVDFRWSLRNPILRWVPGGHNTSTWVAGGVISSEPVTDIGKK
jgi:hypothetical protein